MAGLFAPAVIRVVDLMPVKAFVLEQKRNTLLTPELIAREAWEILRNQVLMAKYVSAPMPHFGGDTIKIRRPVVFA